LPNATRGSRAADAPAKLEGQVEAFLADYGKPPREAVRALLEPTDANIRALLRKQEETMAVAAYVAARMTELQQHGSSRERTRPESPAYDPAALLQMRVTLFEQAHDPDAADALSALRALALDLPDLQAQVSLVGTLRTQDLRAQIAGIPAPLTAAAIGMQDCDRAVLPFLRIEDLRQRRVRDIDARGITQPRLRAAIAALRTAPDTPAIADSAGLDGDELERTAPASLPCSAPPE
jgi:hypothetical protein